MLTNGSCVTQKLLGQESAFGACYAEELFNFFRRLSKFKLNKLQFSLLSGVKLFASDRPLLLEREKISQIQSMYLWLLQESLELNEASRQYANIDCSSALSNQIKYSNMLLALVSLRGLDALSKSDTSLARLTLTLS